MAYNYDYEVKTDDHEFTGELEITPSGVIAIKSNQPLEPMPGWIENEVKGIFESAGKIYSAYGNLEKIEIVKKVI